MTDKSYNTRRSNVEKAYHYSNLTIKNRLQNNPT